MCRVVIMNVLVGKTFHGKGLFSAHGTRMLLESYFCHLNKHVVGSSFLTFVSK